MPQVPVSDKEMGFRVRLGNALKAERERLGMIQADFANMLGIGHHKYSKIEKALVPCPLWVFRKACVLLKKDPMKFLFLKRRK